MQLNKILQPSVGANNADEQNTPVLRRGQLWILTISLVMGTRGR